MLNPFARSNAGRLSSVYRRHEQEKRRIYQERIINVEHGTFTPFVMAATGGLGPAATVVCKRLALLLAEKKGSPYSLTMTWLRTKLAFALLHSAVICLHGSHSVCGRSLSDSAPDVVAEARLGVV